MNDITKLPKWAQAKISVLEANVEHYKKAALEMESGESNVYQRDYASWPEDRRPIKRDSHILFVAEDGTEFDVGFRDDEFEVTLGARSVKDRLAIKPRSSNVVVIEGRR